MHKYIYSLETPHENSILPRSEAKVRRNWMWSAGFDLSRLTR